MELPKQICSAIESVIGLGPVSLHEPHFKGKEWEYLKKCLDTNYVSSVGKFVDKFEQDISTFTGAKYAIATVNGTSALHISLKLAGVKANDEVLIPALTFVATANAVSYCNATPHFVDVSEQTLGIDTVSLKNYLKLNTNFINGFCVNKKTNKIIRAIVPMHTFGHPCDIDEIIEICDEFNLVMIEDAAEALGSYYKHKHVGTFGTFGALSFNGNKIITTGGGGMILTEDENLALKAKHITTTSKLPHSWEFNHNEIGFNYRMPNINAALGCAQLEQIFDKIKNKRTLFRAYQKSVEKIQEVTLFAEPSNSKSNYWLQTLLLKKPNRKLLEEILIYSNNKNIVTRPAWTPLNRLKPYANAPRMELKNTDSLFSRIINIPSNVILND